MKKIVLILNLFCICSIAFGQNINNHWMLENVDIDFSTNTPTVNTIQGGKYGYASVSDIITGDLLFYTDGHQVFNKNHQVMTGGENIAGPAYTFDWVKQPVIILPKPGNNNQYYIFHTFETGCLCTSSNATYNPFTYAVVEFSSSYPLGKVIEQMIFMTTETSRGYDYLPLSMVYSPFINGFFIITSFDDMAFYPPYLSVYKLDENGFSHNPVELYELNSDNYIDKSKGSIKFNGMGDKIGITLNKTQGNIKAKFKLLDFNLETGELSNLYTIETSTNSSDSIESFEFSSDSQKIYYIKGTEVYVRDLNNLSLPAKKLSDSNDPSSFPNNFQHLQRDKYGNIWIASSLTNNNRNKYLHKIESQNSYDNSSISLNYIYLQGNLFPTNRMSLPQVIPYQIPCIENIYMTNTVNYGTQDYQSAYYSIIASNIISNGAVADYKAGNVVVLSDGFNAKSGSNFRAYIEECTNNFSNRIKNINYKESNNSVNNDIIKVKLYPNPNNGVFELFFENSTYKYDEDVQIEIYNINSKLVEKHSQKISDDKLIIDKQNLQSGIYFMRITSKSMSEVVRFIIK